MPASIAAVKNWIGKYRIASGGYSINTAEELQDQYGSSILPLAREHPTDYKLTNALLKRDPPIVITDAVARVWLRSMVLWSTSIMLATLKLSMASSFGSTPWPRVWRLMLFQCGC